MPVEEGTTWLPSSMTYLLKQGQLLGRESSKDVFVCNL